MTCESYWPVVCGVQEAVQRVSEGLAQRGHNVVVATGKVANRRELEHNGVRIDEFAVHGRATKGYRGETREYRDYLLRFRGNVMLNYAAQQWSTDLAFSVLSRLTCGKVLVPCGYSELHNWKWAPYFIRLPHHLRRYDRLVYLSGSYQDKRFGDRHGFGPRSVVIGNGAADEEFLERKPGFRADYGIEKPVMLLCASNYGEGKNQQMVVDAFIEARLTNAELVLIGSADNDYSRELRRRATEHDVSIRVLSGVPRADVVRAFHEADIFVFGSRVECFPLVLVEAMASGTPFVSTDVGCAAELPGGIIARTTSDMAAELRRLSAKGEEWASLARAGRAAWETRYRWSQIVEEYEQVFALVASPVRE